MIANDAVAEDGHAPHFEGSLGFISLPRLESRAVRGLQSLGMKPNASIRYTGEVVYIYAFDVAYDTARKPIRELLGQPVAQFAVDASKRSPRQLFFYRPQMVRLPPMERIGPLGAVRV